MRSNVEQGKLHESRKLNTKCYGLKSFIRRIDTPNSIKNPPIKTKER